MNINENGGLDLTNPESNIVSRFLAADVIDQLVRNEPWELMPALSQRSLTQITDTLQQIANDLRGGASEIASWHQIDISNLINSIETERMIDDKPENISEDTE